MGKVITFNDKKKKKNIELKQNNQEENLKDKNDKFSKRLIYDDDSMLRFYLEEM
jgi:hypothetical protein